MSSLPLISHRMLISALPHERADHESLETSAPAVKPVLVEGCSLPNREFSELVERDAAFNQCEPGHETRHQ